MGKKRESKVTKSKIQRAELIQELLQKCATQSPTLLQKNWEEYLSIYDLVQKIRALERKLELPRRQDHWPQFKQWCISNGCCLDKVDIVSTGDDEYGLVAQVPLEENEMFLEVPRKIVLSTQQARSGTLNRLVETDPMLKNMPNIVLALQLLVEREMSASFWKPYLDILPASYNTVFYFQPEELKVLWGSPVLYEATNLYKNIARQYAYLYTLFQKTDQYLKDTFTYDSYRWAVSTVMTRQNAIPEDNSKMSLALVPLWDMCNHSQGKVCTDFNQESGCLECHAMTAVKPEQEIHIFYGQRSNQDFLLHNGFVYNDNNNRVYTIKLGVCQQDRHYQLRRTVVEKHGISPDLTAYHLPPQCQQLPPSLVKLAAIQVMDKEELAQMAQEGSAQLQVDWSNPVIQRGLKFLRDRLELHARTYKDNHLSNEASPRHQLAAQYVKLEKETLSEIISSISSNLTL